MSAIPTCHFCGHEYPHFRWVCCTCVNERWYFTPLRLFCKENRIPTREAIPYVVMGLFYILLILVWFAMITR